MTPNFEDQYLSQLMNIELAVQRLFDEHPELTDAQVDSVYEELARRYRAEATHFEFKPGKLDGLRADLHEELLPLCEMMLGRPDNILPIEPVTAEELRQILNRLRSSIKTWSKRGGRQAYLTYVSDAMEGNFEDDL